MAVAGALDWGRSETALGSMLNWAEDLGKAATTVIANTGCSLNMYPTLICNNFRMPEAIRDNLLFLESRNLGYFVNVPFAKIGPQMAEIFALLKLLQTEVSRIPI